MPDGTAKTVKVGQAKSGGERPQGVRMWPTPMTALKRADACRGESGAFGELFLRQPHRRPQPSELSTEFGPFSLGDNAPPDDSVYAAERLV